MICSKCKHQNTLGMKYCGACGNPLSVAPMQNNQPPTQTYASPPAAQAPMHQQPPQASYAPPPARHIPNSTYAPPQQSKQPYTPSPDHYHQPHTHFAPPRSLARATSHGKISQTSQILFLILAAAVLVVHFLPTFAITFWGESEYMIIMDLFRDSNIGLTLQMAGIGLITTFAMVLLICPILLAVLHILWRFINQPPKIHFTVSLAISAVGILMLVLIWFGLQDLIPPGWGDLDVDPYIGFFVAFAVYGASLVVSLIFMRTSS